MRNRTKSVLIVEDEVKICESIAFALEEEGWKTHMAHDGDAGMKMINMYKFDVILLDLNLPNATGLTVGSHARASFLNSKTPLFVITGEATRENVLIAKEIVVTRVFCKPLKIDQLVKELEEGRSRII